MKHSGIELNGATVVITGASSGIGRATARAFAREGANVVLVARREGALRETARECEREGVVALSLPADVTSSSDLEEVARRAVERFGSIEVWINNAGTGLFGPFAAADISAHRRVVEVNLFGSMNGAAAALPHFLRQERGVLITNLSIGGYTPVPFAAAYTASKFGLRGFMASLRQELTHLPAVRLCSVFPASVDTPGYRHGANVSGCRVKPVGQILSPYHVAHVMVKAARHPRDEIPVGWTTHAAKWGYALAPRTTERVAGAVIRNYLRRGHRADKTIGNLFSPVLPGTGADDGWKRKQRGPSVLGWAVAGLGVGALLALAGRSDRSAKARSQV